MSAAEPLVAVLYRVPMLVEALTGPLASLGRVRAFAIDDGGVLDLLRRLGPDAVVTDDAAAAAEAARYAEERGAAVMHVALAADHVRVLGPDGWQAIEQDGASPEVVRNALAGELFGRAGR